MFNMCGNLIIGLCWTKCSADCSITNEIFALMQHFNDRLGMQQIIILNMIFMDLLLC